VACNDGDACTVDDRCAAGSCVGGPPLDCNDDDPCTSDRCEALNGCVHEAAAATCDDDNPCTDDWCALGIGCAHSDNAAPCDDGDACTRTDACANGSCRGADPIVCVAADSCHGPGVCDPTSGACSNPALADGSACDDGDACTVGDRCAAGTCIAGTHGVPFRVKDIHPGARGSFPADLVDVNGALFFRADDGASGRELWTSDGTPDGTRLVADLRAGPAGSSPAALTAVGSRVFFTADASDSSRELWVSDGSAAGTAMIVASGTDASFDPSTFFAVGDRLFFVAADEAHGRELWISDGSGEGTHLVKDIRPGRCGAVACSSAPAELTALDRRVLFVASDGKSGRDLWVSDGTADGTSLVADIRPGPTGAEPGFLTALGDAVYFAADDGTHGRELWRSGGTADSTMLVRDIRPGRCGSLACSSSPSYLTAAGDQLFFAVVTDTPQLWRTTGSAGDTVRLAALPSLPYVRHAAHSTLFFSTADAESGAALWRSDGTNDGTVRVAPLSHDAANWLSSSDGRVFFSAADGLRGNELWSSDGTAAGTALVQDINPGHYGSRPLSSFPTSLTRSGRFIFFSADDGSSGRELWAICP